jgi:cysteine synthase
LTGCALVELLGIGVYLKEMNPNIKVVAVQAQKNQPQGLRMRRISNAELFKKL